MSLLYSLLRSIPDATSLILPNADSWCPRVVPAGFVEQVRQLRAHGVIAPDVSTFDSTGPFGRGTSKIDVNSLGWFITLSDSDGRAFGDYETLYLALRARLHRQHRTDAAFDIWMALAIVDCLDFASHEHYLCRLPFVPGPKWNAVLKAGLNELSVSQMFRIIRKGIEQAMVSRTKRELRGRHAANCVPGNIERSISVYLQNRWTVYAVPRPEHMPYSILHETVSRPLLGLPVNYSSVPPCRVGAELVEQRRRAAAALLEPEGLSP